MSETIECFSNGGINSDMRRAICEWSETITRQRALIEKLVEAIEQVGDAVDYWSAEEGCGPTT